MPRRLKIRARSVEIRSRSAALDQPYNNSGDCTATRMFCATLARRRWRIHQTAPLRTDQTWVSPPVSPEACPRAADDRGGRAPAGTSRYRAELGLRACRSVLRNHELEDFGRLEVCSLIAAHIGLAG